MAAKSPTRSIKSRELLGEDLFSQRREVFDKHDTVFLPRSPGGASPAPRGTDGDEARSPNNFRRNGPAHSSMREPRNEARDLVDFRARKYSDNYTSELNQSDEDYRKSMTERTRRLSKMRREFLNSNLHEPSSESPFARSGFRASLPARSGPVSYKIESPNLYKFPFAEPYGTPTPVRRVVLDLGSPNGEGGDKDKENKDPTSDKDDSLIINESTPKIDHQKLFEQLVKKYSPQRKPVDWKLPPTRPKVVGTLPKSMNGASAVGNDVIDRSESDDKRRADVENNNRTQQKSADVSLSDISERNDNVPEMTDIKHKINLAGYRAVTPDKMKELSIPAIIDKISAEGEELQHKREQKTKVKRKRSFIDKLLGRNKQTNN